MGERQSLCYWADCTFFALEEFHKIAFTLKTFIKYGSAPEEYGFTLKNLVNGHFFLFTTPRQPKRHYVWIRASEVI